MHLKSSLLDRIDLQIMVTRPDHRELLNASPPGGESSANARARAGRTRALQISRAGKMNAALSSQEVERDCVPDAAGRQLLEEALQRLAHSARAYHRILRVSRTIADLGGDERITSRHIAEAIGYRQLDRKTG